MVKSVTTWRVLGSEPTSDVRMSDSSYSFMENFSGMNEVIALCYVQIVYRIRNF